MKSIRRLSLLTFLSLFLIDGSDVHAKDKNGFEIHQWPLISKYEESECLMIDDEQIAISPSAYQQGHIISAKLTFFNTGGKIFVNPEINQDLDTLTFSLETANRGEDVSGAYCYLRVNLELKANSNTYSKLYVLVDKTVFYQIKISNNDNLQF